MSEVVQTLLMMTVIAMMKFVSMSFDVEWLPKEKQWLPTDLGNHKQILLWCTAIIADYLHHCPLLPWQCYIYNDFLSFKSRKYTLVKFHNRTFGQNLQRLNLARCNLIWLELQQQPQARYHSSTAFLLLLDIAAGILVKVSN